MHNPYWATLKVGASLYPYEVIKVKDQVAIMREMDCEQLTPFVHEGKQRWRLSTNKKNKLVEAKWINNNWYYDNQIVVMGKCIRYSA